MAFMSASAPTASANLNILASLAEEIVNANSFAIVGSTAGEFTTEREHHELGHHQR
jgi:hypothetical protein